MLNILEKNSTITKNSPSAPASHAGSHALVSGHYSGLSFSPGGEPVGPISLSGISTTLRDGIVGSIFRIKHTDGEKLGIFGTDIPSSWNALKAPRAMASESQKMVLGGSLSEAYCLPIS